MLGDQASDSWLREVSDVAERRPSESKATLGPLSQIHTTIDGATSNQSEGLALCPGEGLALCPGEAGHRGGKEGKLDFRADASLGETPFLSTSSQGPPPPSSAPGPPLPSLHLGAWNPLASIRLSLGSSTLVWLKLGTT